MLRIFTSTILDGNMNTNKNFYPEGMDKEAIRKNFKLRRETLGSVKGFDGLKILTPIQKQRPNLDGKTSDEQLELLSKFHTKYPDGHYVRINQEMIEGYEDLYDLDINADILMIDDSLPKVALAYPVADCPVVFAEDRINNVVAMAHCDGEFIDRELPSQLIDALRKETDILPENIHVYVGPHAKKESFTYDCYPGFIQNPNLWEESVIEGKDGLLHIDMETAILEQLFKQNLHPDNIEVSEVDTITNPMFYSNNVARFNKCKQGRFYEGCFYEGKSLRK